MAAKSFIILGLWETQKYYQRLHSLFVFRYRLNMQLWMISGLNSGKADERFSCVTVCEFDDLTNPNP